MAKSKIIKELANKEVALEVAFNRLLIIASDLNNDDLINWATNELNGYSKDMMNYLKKLANMVYPVVSGKSTYVPPTVERNSVFSPSMNSTLNQMKNRY